MAILKITPAKPIDKIQPILTGTGAKDTTIYIFSGSKNLGAALVDANGDWTFPVTGLRDGKTIFTARESSNPKLGSVSDAFEFTLDTKLPAAPTINAIKLPTNDTTPTLSGRAEKGATVTIYVGDVLNGTTTADDKGIWTLDVTTTLAEGIFKITAKATDAAGNDSATLSRPEYLTVKTSLPTVTLDPSTPAAAKVATQKLTGTADKGAKVQIFNNGVALLAKEVIAGADGKWTASVKLGEGENKLTVQATDTAGNKSDLTAFTKHTLKIDTQPPAMPTVDPVLVAGEAAGKALPVELKGKAEADATVSVYAGSTKLGEATADGSGDWKLDTASFTGPLRDGVQKITAKATDAAGNVSKASAAQSFTLDNKAPAAPTVDTIKLPTSDNTPILTGKAEKGAMVEVFAGTVSLGTATADARGVWRLNVKETDKLDDDTHDITATATDAARNKSGPSRAMKLTVDTQIDQPTMEAVTPTTSKVATQKLEGKTEAGAKVQIYGGTDGKAALGKPVIADRDGNWKTSIKLADGTHELTIVATDVAGNVSQSDPQTVTIDTKAPNAPKLDVLAALSGSTLPAELTGTAEPGTTVTVYIGSQALTEKSVGSDGKWTVDTSAISPMVGTQKITAKATDAAGNVSPASAAVNFKIVPATAPLLRALHTNDDSDTLVFNSLTVADTIADYALASDSIQLSKAVYTALGAVGALTADEFVAGTVATTADHRIIYDSATGKLSYDADGNGADAATLIGTFTSKPTLVVTEFTIV